MRCLEDAESRAARPGASPAGVNDVGSPIGAPRRRGEGCGERGCAQVWASAHPRKTKRHPNRAMLVIEHIDSVFVRGLGPITEQGGDDVYASS